MATGSLSHFLRGLRTSAFAQGVDALSDAQLVRAFVIGGEEAAFAAVVYRHGPMVWQLCRSLLHDPQHAEDAFQATFLVLVQKAASIRQPELLGNWLYGVAYRIAVRARAHACRRKALERDGVDMVAAAPTETDPGDLRPIIHQELQRLPDKYRAPLLLCYFQGKTTEETARLLAWPLGTVKGRMNRARALLRGRLQRRGLALASAALGPLLVGESSVWAAVPPTLLHSTINNALLAAAGKASLPAAVAALARGELQTMLLTKLRKITVAAVVLLVGIGTGLLAYLAPAAPPPPTEHAASPPVAARPAVLPQQDKGKDKIDEPTRRMLSQKNLKNLGLAMHNYHTVLGRLPPAAVLDKNMQPLLSWRVLLLQHLGEQDLFKEFKLDEAWDSAHNKKLLAKMPKVYAAPGTEPKEPFVTYYQVFTGSGTGFEGNRGIRLQDFTDGTSNTALVIEGGEAVPWTKPADLVYEPKKALPKLGGLFKDRVHCGMADGAVITLRPDFVEQAMRNLIVRNDGNIIMFDDLLLQN